MNQFVPPQRSKNNKNRSGGNKQQRRYYNQTHNPNFNNQQGRGGANSVPLLPFPASPSFAYAAPRLENQQQRQRNTGSAPTKKQLIEQELLCPKCTRYYQVTRQESQIGFSLHGPAYSALSHFHYQQQLQHNLRLPFVLPCDHTICGDCIRSAHAQRAIECPECDVCAAIDIDNSPDKSFAINYYLVGRIFLLREESANIDRGVSSMSSFQLAGGGETMPRFVRADEYQQAQQPYNYLPQQNPFNRIMQLGMQMQQPLFGGGETSSLESRHISGDSPTQMLNHKCSMKACASPATLTCVNCESIFCATCSDVLHGGVIAGLKGHVTRPLQPQLLAVCPKHSANVLDFHCVNCDIDLCCYCFIEGGHTTHEHTRLTTLNEDQKGAFHELIQKVEEKLKKLEAVYRVADLHITAFTGSPTAQTIENKQHQEVVANVNKHFADLMAKLLNTHHRLRQKLNMTQHASTDNLRSIQCDVTQRLAAGKNLLSQGKLVADACAENKAGTTVFNIAKLRQELEQMLEWPCCLVDGRQGVDNKNPAQIEFVSDLSENLDKFCALKVQDADQFQLVHEGNIPDGFTIAKLPDIVQYDFPDTSSQSSCQSNDVSSIASTSRQSEFCRPVSALSVTKMPPIKPYLNIINQPIVGCRTPITVVHINSPDSIYVQLTENLPILKAVHNELANYVKSLSASEVSDPKIGEYYIVKQNIHWVRARCLKPSKRQDIYIVQLLETGQMIEVLKLHMRECSTQFRQIQPMAFQCRLHNLYPHSKGWPTEAKKLLENILAIKSGYVSPFCPKHKIGETESCNVTMQVVEQTSSIYSVQLIASRDDQSTVLSNALLFTGLAKPIDTSNDQFDIRTTDGIKIYENSSKMDINQRLRVSLVHVEDPFNICVHLYNFLSHIKDLIRNMNNYYLETQKGIIYTPKIGMYVSVLYVENQAYNWYRGKIVDIFNGIGKVDVLLIDFGKTVEVEYKNLRTLPCKFSMLECQAVHIRLVDIAPPSAEHDVPGSPCVWPEATMEFLREFMKNPGHHLEIAVTEGGSPVGHSGTHSGPFLVLLFECLPLVHYCINAQLVEVGLAKSTGKFSSSDHIAWPQGGAALEDCSSDDARSYERGRRPGAANNPQTTNMLSTSSRLIEGTLSFTLDLLKTIQGSASLQAEREDEEDEDDDEDDNGGGRGKLEVDVLLVKSPEEIYIKMKSRVPEVMQIEVDLIRSMQIHYGGGAAASTQSVDAAWQKGDNIVAYNLQTAQFHRGIIKQVLNQGNDGYLVLCRDRAIDFKAESCSVYPVAEEFVQVPYLCKRMRLANIQPIGGKWSLLATDIISNMCNVGHPDGSTANQKYYYRKAGPASIMEDGEISQPGILWVCRLISSGPLERSRYKYRSINKKLISDGVAVSDTHNNPHILRRAPLSVPNPIPIPNPSAALAAAVISPSPEPSNDSDRTTTGSSIAQLLTPSHTSKAMVKAFTTTSGEDSTTSESDVGTMGVMGKRRANASAGSVSGDSSKSSLKSTFEEPMYEAPITSYLAPIAFPERRFLAEGTYVDEAAFVYLHPQQLAPILAVLDENIQEAVKLFNQKLLHQNQNKKLPYKVGQLCTVRFHMDKKWYRGKITTVIPSNTAGSSGFEYRVQMVDYGNVEHVKYSELCAVVLCPTVPLIATRVRIHQVEPKCSPWNTSVLDTIHSLVVSKTLEVHLCDKSNSSATIHDASLRQIENNINLNEYLLKEFDCLCRGKDVNSIHSDSDEDDVVIIEESETPISTPAEEKSFKYEDLNLFPKLEVGDKRTVRVLDVLNINVVTIEMEPDNISFFKSKYEEIFSTFNNPAIDHQPLTDIRDEVHCLARFSGDGQYYRAEIMSVLPATASSTAASIDSAGVSAHVFFLDYGNREIVRSGHLRSLGPYDPLVRRLPALTRMVALHRIRPLPISPLHAHLHQDTAIDMLTQLLQQTGVTMQIVHNDPKLSVNLLVPKTGELVYARLIADGLVIYAENDDSDDDYNS